MAELIHRNDRGMTPGRKIKGFLWMVFCITAFTVITTLIHTPEPIAETGLYAIAGGGLFLIGGQSLVDAVAARAAAGAPRGSTKRTTTEETVVKE